MSNPDSNFSPQKEDTTMEGIGVEQTPTVYTYVHGDNKRLKLSELDEGKNISSDSDRSSVTSDHSHRDLDLDSTDGSPPRSCTPSPPYKRFLMPNGRFHFETRDDLNYFMDNHLKDLRDEHRLELILTIGNIPRTDLPHLSQRCAELALEYYNEKHKDDYEYKSDYNLAYAGEIIHMNFYASRKVSETRPEPGPRQFFFAELETEHKVLDCCILERSYIKVYRCDDDEIIHPPGMNCSECDPF